MMTTLSAFIGTIAIGTGASAELRQPLGIAVPRPASSQALTLFVTPILYLYMESFSDWLLSEGGPKHG